MPKVFIVGGGVGGLSAAHELAQRPNLGLEVHLFEGAGHFGGKAASQTAHVNNTAAGHLGEHGFRFFPWFYRHLAETFAESQGHGGARVLDLLEDSTHAGLAVGGVRHDVQRHTIPLDFLEVTRLFVETLGAPMPDMARYAGYLLKFHTSCPARRALVYEYRSWSKFCGVENQEYSAGFAELLEAIPTMLVAMRSSKGSARTLGNIGQQMMFDFDPVSYAKVDAVLRGPTSKAWIEPWVAQLVAKGVLPHTDHRLTKIVLSPAGTRVQELQFQTNLGPLAIALGPGDFCVCALPIEKMGPLLTPQLRADPALAALAGLIAEVPWGDMIGVQFFLDSDVPMVKGHVAYPKTPWALTSVSQPQFWRAGNVVNQDLAQEFGVPNLRGVISVIACAWDVAVQDPASAVSGLSASQCSAQEIKEEIWRQLAAEAFPAGQAPQWFDAHLDTNVQDVGNGGFANATPLLVHPPGSYPKRPDAALPTIQNLMLAADYVRTHTELATMEGANEAGRRAVAAILARMGVPVAQHPKVYPLAEGLLFAAARELDCALFRLGSAHLMDVALGTSLLPASALLELELETFDVARLAALPDDVLAGGASRPLVPAAPFLRLDDDAQVSVIPDLRLAHAPYPPVLPPGLSDEAQRVYARFQEKRPELAQFGKEPTREGYREWQQVLQGE